jgi:hypothetical protein
VFFRAGTVAGALDLLERIASLSAGFENIAPQFAATMLAGVAALFVRKQWYAAAMERFAATPFYVHAAALLLVAFALQSLGGRGSTPFVYSGSDHARLSHTDRPDDRTARRGPGWCAVAPSREDTAGYPGYDRCSGSHDTAEARRSVRRFPPACSIASTKRLARTERHHPHRTLRRFADHCRSHHRRYPQAAASTLRRWGHGFILPAKPWAW